MDSDRSPLLLLPGLICDGAIWARQAREIEWPEVIAVSGYGSSRSIGSMAQSVLDKAPPRFAVAGHSMGGRVALEVFRRAPERVTRIALLNSGVHPRQPGEREKRMSLVRLGRDEGMEALVDAWLPPMVHPDRRDDRAFMEPLRQICIRAGLGRFKDQVEALLARPDARPLLKEINIPALVATGREDEWGPVDQHEEIAGEISGAKFVVFERTGHMSTMEAPDVVTGVLQTWLEV